jgi:DNA/RNA endonuclease G (NUC1)
LNFWITGRKFNISGTPTNIASINCNKTPQNEVKAGGQCHNNHNQYNIGFQLMNGDFIELIEVCFDSYLYTTLYTKFTVVSGVDVECQIGERHNYFKIDCFNGISPSIKAAYKTKFQSDIAKREALDRGHLAACADFTYYSQRLATFYYINVVPQWSSFNRGNWKTLEGRIRNYAREANTNLVVYAGSCNVAKEVNTDTDMYLANNTSGGQVVPVPEYLFRIVHNQNTKRSLVFVGINSVHTHTDISQHITREGNCNETESFFTNFNRKDITKGYIYCSKPRDFLDSCNLNNSPLSKFLLQQ